MKYLLTSNKLKGKILLEFTGEGILCHMEVDPQDASVEMMKWFLGRLPLHEAAMDPKIYNHLLKIEPVPEDLSFESFWDAYGYKVGKKYRVKKLWESLDNTDRAAALAGIRKYDRYLNLHKGIAKAYAETYLRHRYWENDY